MSDTYLIYGMHWMLNITSGKTDEPQAVLIRGIENTSGPGRVKPCRSADCHCPADLRWLNSERSRWFWRHLSELCLNVCRIRRRFVQRFQGLARPGGCRNFRTSMCGCSMSHTMVSTAGQNWGSTLTCTHGTRLVRCFEVSFLSQNIHNTQCLLWIKNLHL